MKIITFFFILFPFINTQAQLLDSIALSKEPVYYDITEALKNPEKVYKLDLHKNKLKEIPKDVFVFINLQELNLSKNKLTKIPNDIEVLTKLEILDVSSNNIDLIPTAIGKLVNIKKLILNQNVIAKLSPEIGNLTKMTFLDMWGNEIQKFPDEISKLKNTLKVLDLRVISIKEPLQEEIEQQLPNTKIFFSMSCNCD
ncbi:MAG: leucine-rich repeat domain-containing protein [Bacteroidetes bacterium]|nr:leucine-rich repeat domain-containing protein [Bacteroidota bacterium]